MDGIEVKVQEIDSRSRSNTKRIDNLEERVSDTEKLVSAMGVMQNELGHVKDDVTEIKSDVKSLTSKSGKTYDSLKEKALWLVVGGVIAYIFLTATGINL